jgi:hypothetical protein
LFLAEGFENTKIFAKTWAKQEVSRKNSQKRTLLKTISETKIFREDENFRVTKFCEKRANFSLFSHFAKMKKGEMKKKGWQGKFPP